MKSFLLGLVIGAAAVWFFKPQLVAFWQWCTPWIKRAKTAVQSDVDNLLKKK